MQTTLSDINDRLLKEDIEGLIEAGAPADEYADEAAQIMAAISLLPREDSSEEAIISIITVVWMRSFEISEKDIVLRLPSIQRVASAIYSANSDKF